MPQANLPHDRLREIVKVEAFFWGADVVSTYHGPAASDMDEQWETLIRPILAQFPINYEHTIDFAAGYGRNSRKLLEAGAAHIAMVDVNTDCIEHLKKNFPHDRTAALLNDGMGLSNIGSAACTFLYSFDSMVHFDLEIIQSYMHEFSRVLKTGAYAFLHHSNYSVNPGGNFLQNPHHRNFMSAAIFKHIAMRSGFTVPAQHILSWGKPNLNHIPDLDCITILRRDG